MPWCHAVFLISWLYDLNVLPYIPLTNTSCLCDPKNCTSAYCTHKTQGANHSALQCRPRSHVPPSMLCSQDQLSRGSWDLLDINSRVGSAHRDTTLTQDRARARVRGERQSSSVRVETHSVE